MGEPKPTVSTGALLRNWGLVHLGNAIAAATAFLLYLLYLSGQYRFADGAILIVVVYWLIYLRGSNESESA